MEIEYKFVPMGTPEDQLAFLKRVKSEAQAHIRMTQGYLCNAPDKTVRVRTTCDIDPSTNTAKYTAYLTIKGQSRGLEVPEWEYEIPYEEGLALIELCEKDSLIHKTRYVIEDGLGGTKPWEIDEMHESLEGLIMIEKEVVDVSEKVHFPPWIRTIEICEVSHDSRYKNARLAKMSRSEFNELLSITTTL